MSKEPTLGKYYQ